MGGFEQAKVTRRDQIVIRTAYEAGARITELLTLTVGDWRKRGGKQEATACNKESHGRRVKIIRFSMETAKLLHRYVNEDRVRVDPHHRTLAQLRDHEPLFLLARHKPYSYDAFVPHWERLRRTIGVDLNIHGLRHWHVCQMMRLIHGIAETPGEVERRKEEMVRYMAWRSPETLKAYEHYFQAINHAQMQEVLHRQLDEKLKEYIRQAQQNTLLEDLTSALHTTLPRASGPSSSAGISHSIRLSLFHPLFPRSFESSFALSLRRFLWRSLRERAVSIHLLLFISSFTYFITSYHSLGSAISPSSIFSIYTNPMSGTKCTGLIRDCLSGKILLARALLSGTQGDLSALLMEVKNQLPVPVKGVISDGQETIRSAVAFVFSQIPHQLCQLHYLHDAAMLIFEADRHAKTELKKHVRGNRPIERA
nr:tyrosine-type recombinase/integrase [Ktedonosporobacter rubrisoli]